MKLSKLQDTFTNEYLIVIDSEGQKYYFKVHNTKCSIQVTFRTIY